MAKIGKLSQSKDIILRIEKIKMILSDAHIQKFGFYAEPINMAEYAKKASKLTLT